MTTATCIISTYGDLDYWGPLAERAKLSAENQTVPFDQVIRSHEETLAKARNWGAGQATTEWLCFLDGDDELDNEYVHSMLEGKGDIRRPALLGVQDGVEDDYPVMLPERDLAAANFIPIGAFVRRSQFLRVGGFRELPILEDWDLWQRCYLDGATILPCPEAIYRVNVHQGSRNSNQSLHGQVYSQIRTDYAERFRSRPFQI